jgi:hypothetical protein
LVLLLAHDVSARVFLFGSASGETTFYSAWFAGQPILALPESIAFDSGTASLVSVLVSMNPASNPLIEGISLSTLGLFDAPHLPWLIHLHRDVGCDDHAKH